MEFKKQTKYVFGFGFGGFLLGFCSEIQPQFTANSVGLCHITVRLKQAVNILSLFSWMRKLHHRISYMTQQSNNNSLDIKYIALFALDKVPVHFFLEIVPYSAASIVQIFCLKSVITNSV